MKAVIYTKTGGLEVVKQQSVQMPIPGDNQVLVEVKACALNIGDYQRFQTKNGKIPVSTYITNKLMGRQREQRLLAELRNMQLWMQTECA